MDLGAIRSVGLFSGISEQAAADLHGLMSPMHLARGAVLFRLGDKGDKLYLITEGKIKLGTASFDGRESLLTVLGPGELMGELTLFDPGPRTATATAVTPADLLELSHASMVDWLSENPDAARHLLAQLARRLRRTNEAMSDLVFTDVPGRIAKNLIDLAERFGEVRSDGVYLTHGLTQEELAQLIGASRETVNKALAEFASRGWIRVVGRGAYVLDVKSLSQRAR